MALSPAQLLASQAHGALQRGDLALAAKLSRQAVAQQPRNPGFNHLAGVVAFHAKDFAAAVKYLRKAAEFHPPVPGVLTDLGQVLRAAGRYDDAVKAFRQATQVLPQDADSWDGLGNILLEGNRVAEAIQAFQQGVAIAPAHARLLTNLGSAQARAGQVEAARVTLGAAMRLAPGAPDPAANLATVEAEEGDPVQARALATQVLAKHPTHLTALLALANAEQKLGDLVEAERLTRHALALYPDNGQLLLSLASVLADSNQDESAAKTYDQVLAQSRANPKALTGLSRIHVAAGRFDDARALLHEALAVDPDWYPTRMDLALLELSLGRFEQAFPHYNWRFQLDHQRRQRPFTQPKWDGVRRPGQKLLLWGEQGIGDEVLWLSLLPDLLAAGMELVVECDGRLLPLLQRSFPTVTAVAGAQPPSSRCLDGDLVQLSFAELCRHVHHDVGVAAYLRPDPQRVRDLRERLLEKSAGKPLVGVSWRSVTPLVAAQKTLELQHWGPILRQSDVAFVVLQYGNVEADLAAAEAATGVRPLQADGVDIMNDLDGFAALVAAMDKVITTSNTTVHFAGAVGVQTHLLLPKARGKLWYYGVNETSSRWYGSLRIHRQSVQDRWDDVLESARRAAFP